MIGGTQVYTDFAGLAELEADAARSRPEATREAARQFEAMFVQMMLDSMRQASSVLAEDRDTTYEEMFDRQVALELTRHKGIGIADLLMRQLGQDAGGATDAAETTAPAQARARIAARAEASPVPAREDFRPDGPDDFLQRILPLAERAGEALGVDPRAIAAQATLETGWGQRLIRDGEGVSGNNLFGIKADARWDGERLAVGTVEYRDGLARREKAQFRVYENLERGFEDYVDFLRSNPRYAEALGTGRDPAAYAASLQQAGYATDPDYANKISDIMESPRFREAVAALKNGGRQPI